MEGDDGLDANHYLPASDSQCGYRLLFHFYDEQSHGTQESVQDVSPLPIYVLEHIQVLSHGDD